jgi:hypothetical protein
MGHNVTAGRPPRATAGRPPIRSKSSVTPTHTFVTDVGVLFRVASRATRHAARHGDTASTCSGRGGGGGSINHVARPGPGPSPDGPGAGALGLWGPWPIPVQSTGRLPRMVRSPVNAACGMRLARGMPPSKRCHTRCPGSRSELFSMLKESHSEP